MLTLIQEDESDEVVIAEASAPPETQVTIACLTRHTRSIASSFNNMYDGCSKKKRKANILITKGHQKMRCTSCSTWRLQEARGIGTGSLPCRFWLSTKTADFLVLSRARLILGMCTLVITRRESTVS